ncbi:MAG: hypothetical protein AB1567_09865, partial [bacterium]
MKKLLLALFLVGGLSSCAFAEEVGTKSVHFGFSGMRISDHEGVHKFAQVNGSLKPSIEGTDIDWKDWQKRGY